QDLLLQDVERIEVIRGPGASVWGANAVNGIINIITKSAKETQGGLITAGGGSALDRGMTGVRYGGQLGDNPDYSRRGERFEPGTGFHSDGLGHEPWDQGRGGFRCDWTPNRQDTVTLQGQMFGESTNPFVMTPTPFPQTAPPLTPSSFLFTSIDHRQLSGGDV